MSRSATDTSSLVPPRPKPEAWSTTTDGVRNHGSREALAFRNGVLAIGAPGGDEAAVHMFEPRGSAWSRTQIIRHPQIGRRVSLTNRWLVSGAGPANWGVFTFDGSWRLTLDYLGGIGVGAVTDDRVLQVSGYPPRYRTDAACSPRLFRRRGGRWKRFALRHIR
jgi:hypothetical protein